MQHKYKKELLECAEFLNLNIADVEIEKDKYGLSGHVSIGPSVIKGELPKIFFVIKGELPKIFFREFETQKARKIILNFLLNFI
jgi:hypothetical protein